MIPLRRLLFIVLLTAACQAPPPPAPEPMTDREREAQVIDLLQPVTDQLKTAVGERRAGIAPLRKDGSDYEPRVSRYLVPLMIDRLVQDEVALIERRDLDEVVAELERQMSDLMDETTTVEVGNISGVELLVIGSVQDKSRTDYRIVFKVIDLETARILFTERMDLPRELLPIKYGGI